MDIKIFRFSSLILFYLFISCNSPSDFDNKNNGKKEVTAYITAVELKALDKNGNNYFHSDTLKEQIVIEVKTLYRLEGGTWEDFYNDSDSTNDERLPEVTNPIVWGKCWFKFNKDIESDGIIVKANSNILDNNNLEGRYFFAYSISPFAIHNIRMNKEHFQIKKGLYKIYAAWENVEGKIFADAIDVLIDIAY
jgi:hypothetical protein